MLSLYNILDESIAFQKKLERDTHNRLMSKKEDIILESVTEYAQNPDTYDKNIEILKSQPNVSYKNRQLSLNFFTFCFKFSNRQRFH
jgi:predicted RNA methylase